MRPCASAYRHEDVDDQQYDLEELPEAVEAGELSHLSHFLSVAGKD